MRLADSSEESDSDDAAAVAHWFRRAAEGRGAATDLHDTPNGVNVWILGGFLLSVVPAILAMLIMEQVDLSWLLWTSK